ncbi:MAG: glycosyltransferase [Syntrophobacteraceae bacterium]|nr:glycosyltransferase [Syntrophobacteraceae bacterium]
MKPLSPSLSVCMIVKNEAHQLAEAVENFSQFADEIVIVDTGSTDNTRDIALQCTGRVYDFSWCDDFSAARNHSFAQAQGDYLLWMDADDRVEPEMARQIVELKSIFDGRNAFYFVLEDMEASGPSCAFYQLRCVPRRDDVRFCGRIHEQLTIGELFPLTIGIVIRHHGYLHKEIHQHKIERNLRLLEKEREDGRDDAFIHYYLSLTCESLKRYREAIEHMNRALACIERQTRASSGPYTRQVNMSAMMDIHFHLARFHRKANSDQTALRHATLAQALTGDDARSLFNLGMLFQECHEPRKAIHCFERSLRTKPVMSLFPSAPLPSRERILAHIAFSHLRLREHDAAMTRLREAWELAGDQARVWETLGFLALNAREWAIALHAYESASLSGEISAVGYYFLGFLFQQRKLMGKALDAYKKALDRDPTHVKSRLGIVKVYCDAGLKSEAGKYVEGLLKDGIEEAEIFSMPGCPSMDEMDSREVLL